MATATSISTYQMLIGGEWADAASGDTYESMNPYTGQTWATMPDAQAEDVDRAVQAARKAVKDPAWRRMVPAQRAALLRSLADLVAADADHLGQIETRDNGKLIREMTAQCKAVPSYFHFYAGLADKIQGATIPLEKTTVFNYTVREPIGVVAILIPWNSPLLLLSFSIAAALAAGNAVVIKPSEHASASTLEFARLIEQAGFPPGIVNVVTGMGPVTGAALSSHPGVGKICFTGGVETARKISEQAALNLTPTLLELGGKSPNIVFSDADIQNAVNGTIAGIFAAGGQTCVAGSRSLVHEDVHDEFLERLIERTKKIKMGDPSLMESELGPLATIAQLAKVESFVESAKSEGADLVYGGQRPDDPSLTAGWFFMPTIFDRVANSMYLAQEEIFGPVLGVLKFREEEEAIAMANDTDFGLAAGIWTNDVRRAHRVAQELDAGTVWINMYRALSYASPFGGYKGSGHGRELGIEAINEFTQVKSVWVELAETTPDPFVLRI